MILWSEDARYVDLNYEANVLDWIFIIWVTLDKVCGQNTIFEIMGKFHDFGKIQFRSTPPKLSLNWETGNLPK